MDRQTALDICVKHDGSTHDAVAKNNSLSDEELITKAKLIKDSSKPIYEVFLELENKDFYLGV